MNRVYAGLYKVYVFAQLCIIVSVTVVSVRAVSYTHLTLPTKRIV